MAQEAGCSRIIGVDTNPDKEKRARDMGITDFVNPKEIKVVVVVGGVVVVVGCWWSSW
jgi:Zn-dependent alcohol dehydrogenase